MSHTIIRLCGEQPARVETCLDDAKRAGRFHSGLTPGILASLADRDELVIELYELTSGDGYDEKLIKRSVFSRKDAP